MGHALRRRQPLQKALPAFHDGLLHPPGRHRTADTVGFVTVDEHGGHVTGAGLLGRHEHLDLMPGREVGAFGAAGLRLGTPVADPYPANVLPRYLMGLGNKGGWCVGPNGGRPKRYKPSPVQPDHIGKGYECTARE
jgi:hypothetical protein